MGISGEVKNKAVFLDRDGVINKAVVIDGRPYPPANLEELEILIGVKEGISALKSNGFKIFVVTNQPDVARGKTSKETVETINRFLKNELNIDQIYCCFHDGKENCACRKPKPGMLLDAAKDWNLDLSCSFMIGDRWRDVEAGKLANITTILIEYGYDEKRIEPDFACADFSSAVNYILFKKPKLPTYVTN
jgi:D-glycero-D-manno-heptose 1,7-bisphosphate phosphatase